MLAGAYRDEPTNPFVLNAYARTLFWIDDRRDQSLDLNRRLIALLDQQGGTNDSVVVVDLWFHEAYWKIASLYLDRGEYKNAAVEITRFIAAPGPRDSPVWTQASNSLISICSRSTRFATAIPRKMPRLCSPHCPKSYRASTESDIAVSPRRSGSAAVSPRAFRHRHRHELVSICDRPAARPGRLDGEAG